jgi:hypothetical protein
MSARHLIFGNGNHHADSVSKVHANWVAGVSTMQNSNPQTYVRPEGAVVANTWTRVAIAGPLHLSLMPDNSSYLLRCRLLVSSPNVSHTCTFAIVFGRASEISDIDAATGRSAIAMGSTTSTSPTWIAPSPDTIRLDRDIVEPLVARERTLMDTGGAGADVLVCEALAVVYAKTTNAASLPQVHGIHIAEFAP